MRGTRLTYLLLVISAGCGSTTGNTDAGPVIDASTIDGGPTPDGAMATCTPQGGTNVSGRVIENVGDVPVLVTAAPGDRRLFVLERDGIIRIIEDETARGTPFLDIRNNAGGPVLGGGEQGLLGLAFHPSYTQNGKLYVFYTTSNANVIAEYQRTPGDSYTADPGTARVVLSIPDFAGNHNGGMMEFGSDGYLYISTGDGGGGNDPQETGQDLNRLLGKMLRLDVDNPSGGREYGIPATNPFAVAGGAPEVYMYGLRNPWRWSFDRANGDIYIGDVGQGEIEEVSYVAAAAAAGKDFGWDACEGTHDFVDTPGQPDQVTDCVNVTGNRLRPVYEQDRTAGSVWNSVIGGQVYRGSCYPDLVGRYFFSDYNGRSLWSFVIAGGVATDIQQHTVFTMAFGRPVSLHADALGELYIAYENGDIRHIEAN